MGVREDIAELRVRIAARLLPAYVAELQALERALAAGERGLNARWHDLRQGVAFELSTAFSRLYAFEKALRVVEQSEAQEAREHELHAASLERFGQIFETYEPTWGAFPDHKRAAANDRDA